MQFYREGGYASPSPFVVCELNLKYTNLDEKKQIPYLSGRRPSVIYITKHEENWIS